MKLQRVIKDFFNHTMKKLNRIFERISFFLYGNQTNVCDKSTKFY